VAATLVKAGANVHAKLKVIVRWTERLKERARERETERENAHVSTSERLSRMVLRQFILRLQQILLTL